MQKQRFFLSHYSGDREVAETIANILQRVTLEQIQPWYSSDSTSNGGLNPGDIWFNQIISKLNESSAVVAIITPNSINRPWLYFETGIAQALQNCEVIPVCIGTDRDKIYPPLAAYQIYQLSDYRSLKEFIEKLLTKFEIKFDEEMTKPVLEGAITKLTSIGFEEIVEDKKLREVLNDLRSHIDKRFIEIWEKPNLHITDSRIEAKGNLLIQAVSKDEDSHALISLKLISTNNNSKIEQFIEIRNDDSFSDITTSIYFIISKLVNPYTYLESWVLKDPNSGKFLIIREIGDLIPAISIFKNIREVEVIFLEKPYHALDSKQRVTS